MLNQAQETLWQAYLKHEEVKFRPRVIESLEKFVIAVETEPIHQWSDWAYSICHRVVDEGEDIPVRYPLFIRILFPALFSGYQEGRLGCARWLAGFYRLIYQSPECQKQLGEGNFGQIALLRTALVHDPKDESSRVELIRAIADGFEYALHELPAGVLYDHNGASLEQCLELEKELAEFRGLVKDASLENKYVEIIKECQTHFSAYRDYLQRWPEYQSYEAYLNHYNIPY